jgi:hypothetical protein
MMTTVLISKKPYKLKIFNIRDIISEICFVAIHILTIFLLNVDQIEETDHFSKIGIAIISLCSTIILVHFLVILYEYYLMIKKWVISLKKYLADRKKKR